MHPVLFKSAHFTLYSYGLCVALAMTLAWVLAAWFARRFSYSATEATDLLFVVFVTGIAGARLFYAFQHPEEYAGRWQAVFFLQEGGLVWYGGFLLAVACTMALAGLRRMPVLAWADFFSPILAVSHGVGRIGCFLNGCCLGKNGHPVQLYETALSVALSFFLFARFSRRKKEGEIFGLYLVGYGCLRFTLEFLRADQRIVSGLTIPQWISLALAGAGLFILSPLFRSHVRDRVER